MGSETKYDGNNKRENDIVNFDSDMETEKEWGEKKERLENGWEKDKVVVYENITEKQDSFQQEVKSYDVESENMWTDIEKGYESSIYEKILSIEENLKAKGRKCLVIDDSKFTRLNIIDILTKHDIFDLEDIIEAEDGIEGINKFTKFMVNLDIVICDVQMRNMDGLKFIKAVNNMKKEYKARGDMKTYFLINIIPIITITGTAPGVKLEALEIGAKDFVFKSSREITIEDFEKEIVARTKIHITLKRTYESLLSSTEALYQMSIIDPLTGAYNRRHMNEVLKIEYSRALRNGSTLSVVIFDIDNFKNINDTYGHTVGDRILCELVSRIKNVKRDYDQIFRFGGDEFLVMMPETRSDGIKSFYERVRETIQKSPVKDGNIVMNFTISAGATFFPSKKTRTLEELIKNADDALYNSKKSGKNQLTIFV